MNRNVPRTTDAKAIAHETKLTANRLGELIGPAQDWAREPLRKAGAYGRYLAGIARLRNPVSRRRRDDTPPTAAVVM